MKKIAALLFVPFVLSSCGFTTSDTHSFKMVSKINPTCEETGVKFHYHCDHCNKDFVLNEQNQYVEATKQSLVIGALGHDYTNAQVEHTRTGESATATVFCTRAGCTHSRTESKSVFSISDSATCLEGGKKQYLFKFSSIFGGDWIDYENSSPTGHHCTSGHFDWSNDFSTCTATGLCDTCGAPITETKDGVYVIDTVLIDSTPEKGHFKAIFDAFGIAETEKNSYDKFGDTGFTAVSLQVINAPANLSYVSGDTFNLSGSQIYVVYKNGCRALLENNQFEISYENGGSSFLTTDTKVTISYGGISVTFNVQVSKRQNTISGSDVFTEVGRPIDLSGVTVGSNSYTYKIIDSKGTEINEDELMCGNYSLKIHANENSEYFAKDELLPLTVIHHANEDGNCIHCNEFVFGNVYYEKSSNKLSYENAEGSLASLADNPTITDTSGSSYSFNEKNPGDFNSLLFKNKNNAVIVDVPVVTKAINSIEELRNTVFVPYTSSGSTIGSIDGYYVLGQNIDASGSNVYNTDPQYGIQWAEPNGYETKGFIGTFDGKGHTISNLKLSSNGYGGMFGLVGTGANIRNFNLTHLSLDDGHWYKYCSLAYIVYSATFEKISLQFDHYADYSSNVDKAPQSMTKGLISAHAIRGDSLLKDISINCKGLTIGAPISSNIFKSTLMDNVNVICNGFYNLGTDESANLITKLQRGLLISKKEASGSGLTFMNENKTCNYTKIGYVYDSTNPDESSKKAATYFVSKAKQLYPNITLSTQQYTSTQANNNISQDSKIIVFGADTKIKNLGYGNTLDMLKTGDYLLVPEKNMIWVSAKGEGGYNLACLDLLKEIFGFDAIFDEVCFSKDGVTRLPTSLIHGSSSIAIRQDDGSGYSLDNQKDNSYGNGFYSATPFHFAGSKGYYHNSYSYLPPETYGASHPNWYATYTTYSKRNYKPTQEYSDPDENKIHNNNNPIFGQLCYTAHGNATEYNLMVKTAGEFLYGIVQQVYGKPNANIMFGIQDNWNMCECNACKTFKNQHGSDSAAYIKFANDIDNYVRNEKGWDKDFSLVLFAYDGTTDAPTGITLNDDVTIMYAPIHANYQVSLGDPVVNREYKNNFDAWAKLTKRVFAWTYEANFALYLYAHNTFDSMQETYRFLERNNTELLYVEDQQNISQFVRTGFSRLKHYLRGALERDTNANQEALTDKFFNNYYLDASNEMRQFYNSWLSRNRYQYAQEGFASNEYHYRYLYFNKTWNKNELLNWVSLCDQALAKIEKYKNTDNALYQKLVNRIKVESIFPRWVLISLFNYYTNSSFISSFKSDCANLGITKTAEGYTWELNADQNNGTLQYWFNKWGV